MAFNTIAASVTTMPTISWRLLNDDDKNNYKKKNKRRMNFANDKRRWRERHWADCTGAVTVTVGI